jgi:hypothetical protein
MVIVGLHFGGVASAACTDSQQQLVQCGIYYYNIKDEDQNCVAVPLAATDEAAPLGGDNREATYNFFISKGLSSDIAAGFVGNLMQESHINPKSVNSIGATGIAQWLGGRKKNLLKRANYEQLTTQLDFIWAELNGGEKSAFAKIKSASGLSDITYVIRKFYERPGEAEANDANRLKEATKAKNQFGEGTGVLPVTTAGAPPSGDCSISDVGSQTRFLNNYVVYYQGDPSWANHPYGSSTIKASGCGPSSLAMVVTNLTGQKVTPIDTADYGTKNGTYQEGVGSSWALFTQGPANWGLKSQQITSAQIAVTLQQGGLVIASGTGSAPFTSGGHIITIRGVTATGKLLIGDPGRTDTSDKEWDFNQLVSQARGFWAVTK